MKKKLNVTALALVLAASLTACGAPAENNTATENAQNNTAAADTANNANANANAEANDADAGEVVEMKGADLDKMMEDKDAKEKILVIDVRPEEEYDEGHVKFAINMPIDTFEDNLDKIEDLKDFDIATICNTGKKSAEAADILVKNGFKKVANAEGVKSYDYTTMTKVTNVRGPEFLELAKSGDYTVIDARDAEDFDKGHLDGAINVLLEEFDEKYGELPTDKPFLVHCYSGNRSWEIASKLVEKGHDATNSLDGTKEYDGFNLD
ncbi:MAG: rhodanese-like domain-containing protein [Peptoniphilus sp.]|nr:rhodanese-like domain-containing protein [Peptoniphilus sp.]MDD7362559.1 rhodanese-like domain-containing protein [Bacillota bacterium]MDY6045042.1 rhodanese-like domain-containing protein [Peptoniphilus sp.]